MANGGRKTQLQVTHEISVQFGFGQTSGIIGVLPAGAVIAIAGAVISQAWNSTTALYSVGTTPGGTQIWSGANFGAIGRGDVTPAAAASGPFPTDQPIYGTIALTGPAPTQGVATAWVSYLPGAG